MLFLRVLDPKRLEHSAIHRLHLVLSHFWGFAVTDLYFYSFSSIFASLTVLQECLSQVPGTSYAWCALFLSIYSSTSDNRHYCFFVQFKKWRVRKVKRPDQGCQICRRQGQNLNAIVWQQGGDFNCHVFIQFISHLTPFYNNENCSLRIRRFSDMNLAWSV